MQHRKQQNNCTCSNKRLLPLVVMVFFKHFFEKGLHPIVLLPVSKWDFIIRVVQVSSYIPGRIRLYSNKLIGNTELSHKVYAYVASYKEIDKVDINIVTGSILITYRPELLRSNKELAKVEQYIMNHVERRG